MAIGSLLMATGPMAAQPLAPGNLSQTPQAPAGASKSKAMAIVQVREPHGPCKTMNHCCRFRVLLGCDPCFPDHQEL